MLLNAKSVIVEKKKCNCNIFANVSQNYKIMMKVIVEADGDWNAVILPRISINNMQYYL